MNNAPIGVFDSGMGGLTVWSELYHCLPQESLIYYGDGKNCPYGNLSREETTEYVDLAVRRMMDRGVKMIVVACNTATATSIDYLRSTYSIPFVGMEPAVKPAALSSKSGVIAILATASSLKGDLFRETSARYADQVRILTQEGRGFVELVESNREESPEAYARVAELVEPLLAEGADRLVLGCTHYPFLSQALHRVIGNRPVELINPAPAICRRVEALLAEFDLQAESKHQPTYDYMTSAEEEYLERIRQKAHQAQMMNFD